MHSKHLPTFNNEVRSCLCSHGAFDNYQRTIRKKFVSTGKLALVQVGTALVLCKKSPFHLPLGTKMRSPSGVPLVVLACVLHSATHFKILGFVTLDFMIQLSASNKVCGNLHLYDQRRIIEGFLYPEFGWTVSHVPGLSPMPPVTYLKEK